MLLGAGNISAQTNNANVRAVNADPVEKRFLARVHNGISFNSEAEWEAIQPLVQKVFVAQRDLAYGGALTHTPIKRS